MNCANIWVPQITLEGSRDQNLRRGALSAPSYKVGLRVMVGLGPYDFIVSPSPNLLELRLENLDLDLRLDYNKQHPSQSKIGNQKIR